MLRAVQAVQTFQDKQWIPKGFQGQSYFSENDVWHYFAISDARLCENCAASDGQDVSGDSLRLAYPDLEVIDENLIRPHVHVTLGWRTRETDTCRCLLVRVMNY